MSKDKKQHSQKQKTALKCETYSKRRTIAVSNAKEGKAKSVINKNNHARGQTNKATQNSSIFQNKVNQLQERSKILSGGMNNIVKIGGRYKNAAAISNFKLAPSSLAILCQTAPAPAAAIESIDVTASVAPSQLYVYHKEAKVNKQSESNQHAENRFNILEESETVHAFPLKMSSLSGLRYHAAAAAALPANTFGNF